MILSVLATPAVLATGYLGVLSLLSKKPPPEATHAPHWRFDVVVPAHDEKVGVAATVASLLSMDYPPDLFRVVVVADNCTDDTAERAANAGANVIVRDEPSLRGKGYALAHAFDRILYEGRADAVVVVDADTVVSPNLLRAVEARLDDGASVVQADYEVQNPYASWRTLLMTIAFATAHTLRSRGRERLGVSVGLHGNGMCFTTALLREARYDAYSIVEDLEYALRLGEAGHRVVHAGEARVLGDMPAGEQASRTQRARWEGGRARLIVKHLPRLMGAAIFGDRVALDLAAELLVPPLATLAVFVATGLALSTALSLASGVVVMATWAWAACAALLLAHVARGWQLSRTGWRGLAAFAHIPGYIAWKLTLPLRRATHANDEWVRTAREEGHQ